MNFKRYVNESGLSRLWKIIEKDNYGFGVISAYRTELPENENKKRYENLKVDIKNRGFGFVELRGKFKGRNELSLFIPMLDKKNLLDLCKKYDQETIIYKDNNEFIETNCNGKIVSNFVKGSGKNNLTFDQELFKQFFSSLKKGSHRDKKFLFTMQEREIFSFNEIAYSKRDSDPQWITVFQDYI